MIRTIGLFGLCLGLASCSGPACLQAQSYQTAKQFPRLEAPPGLSVPEPDPNFEVPEVADGPVGTVATDGADPEQPRRCLESPPRLRTDKA